MEKNPLGRTGLQVSRLSFGASSLGGVFRTVDENEAVRAVHAALDAGINYLDVAPAYGATRAETVLGRALREVPRARYFLSTKVGKYTNPGAYGDDTLDYSRARIRASLDESAHRLGVDTFDIVHLHDIEYQGRKHTEWALGEGLEALRELKREGRIGAVGFGIYPMDLWHRVLADCDPDAALVHNHYCLNDTRLLELLPVARRTGVGIINGSPFGSGLLTDRGPADWHPAGPEERAVFRRAAEFCREQGTSLSKLALQFASQNPEIPTTLFSSASPESVARNVEWHEEPFDPGLIERVQSILASVRDKQWSY
jgi:aryl-alcohol dehydrogenase-like predicted oxidoreductase